MPKKTIYIREGDKEVWEKAEQFAGDSLSGLLSDVLRRYVAEKEGVQQGMERIELEISVYEGGLPTGRTRKVAFQGREVGYRNHGHEEVTAYLTQKGQYAFLVENGNGAFLNTCETLEEVAETYGSEFANEIAEESGKEYVEELDI